MKELGFRTLHNDAQLANRSTRQLDKDYDFLSDAPVPLLAPLLLATHPGNKLAGVMLSLRPHGSWLRARRAHHVQGTMLPCGFSDHDFSDAAAAADEDEAVALRAAARHMLLYDGYAACLARGRPTFVFNLFSGEGDGSDGEAAAARPGVSRNVSNSKFAVGLHAFLKEVGRGRAPKHVVEAVRTCDHHVA